MSPAVILVRPEIPENIGFVARSLACYGWDDLRLVGGLPADPGPAWKTVSGGEAVLRSAKPYPSLKLALSECHLALGFSRRPHRDGPWMDMTQAVEAFSGTPSQENQGKIALVFGPESQGLNAKDGEFIHHWVGIPMRHPTLSLNLSHAVTLAIHAFGSPSRPLPGEAAVPVDPSLHRMEAQSRRPASLSTLEAGWDMIYARLRSAQAFPAGKSETQFSYLRQLWNRMRLTQGEAELLIGALKKIIP